LFRAPQESGEEYNNTHVIFLMQNLLEIHGRAAYLEDYKDRVAMVRTAIQKTFIQVARETVTSAITRVKNTDGKNLQTKNKKQE
jgi:hypothetical protein